MSYLCDTLHINQAGNLPRFVAGIFMPVLMLHMAVSYPRVEC
ncbi:hypothetical protein BOVAC1_1239 [Bacteroides ovatus]|nr:hypothetical protein BOVAC1_1239 [Bacteroides ovatus]CAG9900650.1 hypothetical protein BOVA514_5090 [Bacteroides ovatus]